MNWLQRKRIVQAIKYGWSDAKKISTETGKSRWHEYITYLSFFRKYFVFSNQYMKERLWSLPEEDRERKGKEIGKTNHQHDDWVIDMYQNRKFIAKWSQLKWETSPKRTKRRKQAYTKQFHAGKGFRVQRNVDIHREHYLDGTITIGNNVLFAKNVFIDYSGDLVIHDNVALANGVIIETHTHDLEINYGQGTKGHLDIADGVKILSRAYIADTCHSIGRYARIGAGSYVRKDVPPYAIVMGNPAKIVGFLFSPDEMVKFEEGRYAESERTPYDKYTKYYELYYKKRIKDLSQYFRF